MGSADIIPGVSGGTIAFITGIYEELLSSIKSIDLAAVKLLLTGQFKSFWTKISGPFLLVLFSGILVSLFSLARLIGYLLSHHPIQLWAFFFGLILISALVVSKDITQWTAGVIMFFLVGIVSAYFITKAVPTETSNSYLFVFFSGAIAICAMILPGISGSFILLILGKYSFILNAVKEFNLGVIIVFALGCLTGLLTFSRAVSWLLTRYKNVTIALLAGFMIGSLNKVWPWKETLVTYQDRHGALKPLVEANILPHTFETQGSEAHLATAIVFFIIGMALVFVIERTAVKKNG